MRKAGGGTKTTVEQALTREMVNRMTVVSSWSCLALIGERGLGGLLTGTRVPHRVPPPTFYTGMFGCVSLSQPWACAGASRGEATALTMAYEANHLVGDRRGNDNLHLSGCDQVTVASTHSQCPFQEMSRTALGKPSILS